MAQFRSGLWAAEEARRAAEAGPYRFDVGTRVECLMGPNEWSGGKHYSALDVATSTAALLPIAAGTALFRYREPQTKREQALHSVVAPGASSSLMTTREGLMTSREGLLDAPGASWR